MVLNEFRDVTDLLCSLICLDTDKSNKSKAYDIFIIPVGIFINLYRVIFINLYVV